MTSFSDWTSFRVMRSSSDSVRFLGSQHTPPFAPPKGTSTTAVFHVFRLDKLQPHMSHKVFSAGQLPIVSRLHGSAHKRSRLQCGMNTIVANLLLDWAPQRPCHGQRHAPALSGGCFAGRAPRRCAVRPQLRMATIAGGSEHESTATDTCLGAGHAWTRDGVIPANVIHGNLWREPEATLKGASAVVMLHSVGVEDLYLSIVAHYVQLYMYLSLGCQLRHRISNQCR